MAQVIAHRLSTVIGATKIMVLDKGYVIEEGSHSECLGRSSSRFFLTSKSDPDSLNSV